MTLAVVLYGEKTPVKEVQMLPWAARSSAVKN